MSKGRTPKKFCSIPGCDRGVRAMEMCGMHYQRSKKHGDPIVRLRQPNGHGSIGKDGYVTISTIDGKIKQHILIAEHAIGRRLPIGAEVHHFNRNKSDNRNQNLVICPDRKYHALLHARQDAMDACGNPDWRRCWICLCWDSIDNLPVNCKESSRSHSVCWNGYQRKRYAERKISSC